jgi:hypothetical protein
MQGYSKGSLVPLILVYYNGYVEASIQGYSMWTLGPLILVYYNG